VQRTSPAPVRKLSPAAGLPKLAELLAAELRVLVDALVDRRLWLLLAMAALLLALAAQAPLHYRINVGQEDRPGADLPLLVRFNTPERDSHGRFRWTDERSIIRLPGLGRRPVELRLTVFPIGPEVARVGPKQVQVWARGELLAELPVRPEGAIYRLALSPAALAAGQIELRSATFSPPGDPRQLGVPLTSVAAYGLASRVVLPDLTLLLRWLAAFVLGWALLRRLEFGGRSAFALLLPAVALLVLATALDPPRTALGARPLLETLLIAYLFALVLARLLPPLARRLDMPLDGVALRWLVLLVVLAAGLRYGGKIYPYAMPGDIGFHANRFNDVVVRGMFVLIIPHRGIDLPYPPAFYMLMAPLRLTGIELPTLLRLGQALIDGLSVVLVYALACILQRATGGSVRRDIALLAAGIYGFAAAGFMAFWWNFSTFIYSQFVLLLLLLALALLWPRLVAPREPQPWGALRFWLAFVVLLFVLSHSTALMNAALLIGGGGVLLLLAWRFPWARSAAWSLLLPTSLALLLAFAVYYSNYTAMFLEQFSRLASGGLTGLAERAPVGRDVLWRTLWYDGLITHFGFFPLPLAFVGLALLARRASPARPASLALPALMALVLAIGVGFALLPFISGSTLATRYLMFALWAVALGAAVATSLLWQRGRMGRVLVLAAGAFLLWVTLAQWVAALAWRVRPPEPF
jgi:hypothetical protein